MTKLHNRAGSLVAANIVKIRNRRGLSQAQLAKKFGSSQAYVSLIESGDRMPSLEMLGKIAYALDVDVRRLFE